MTMDRSIAGWSERQRLAFIERLLFWRGTINRRDLCDYYGISLPQATKDLVAYTSMNPGACEYDVRKKCYVAKARMRPCLVEPDFSTDMDIVGASMHTEVGAVGEVGEGRRRRVCPWLQSSAADSGPEPAPQALAGGLPAGMFGGGLLVDPLGRRGVAMDQSAHLRIRRLALACAGLLPHG